MVVVVVVVVVSWWKKHYIGRVRCGGCLVALPYLHVSFSIDGCACRLCFFRRAMTKAERRSRLLLRCVSCLLRHSACQWYSLRGWENVLLLVAQGTSCMCVSHASYILCRAFYCACFCCTIYLGTFGNKRFRTGHRALRGATLCRFSCAGSSSPQRGNRAMWVFLCRV